MQEIYFSADYHLFHSNIIKYSNRPFKDSAEMNACILDKLNERVKKNDYLYFLGDLAFWRNNYTFLAVQEWLKRVACRNICVIRGNHDKYIDKLKDYFCWIKDYKKIKVGDQEIVLMHYAMRVWDKSHYGSWQLFAHSHGSLPDDPNSLSMDVGVDTNNFYPYHFEEIKERMSRKNFVPIDHHRKDRSLRQKVLTKLANCPKISLE